MKRIVITILSACLMIALLCACGGTKYTLIAYDYDGHVIAADSMTSELTLNDSGSGSVVINGSGGRISWSEEDGVLTIRSGGDTITGTLRDGVAAIDFGDGTLMYYAAEGADTSSLNVMTFEEYAIEMVRGD